MGDGLALGGVESVGAWHGAGWRGRRGGRIIPAHPPSVKEDPVPASHRAFVEFEPSPLRLVLAAVARSEGRPVEALRPTDRLLRPEALRDELAALGLAVDLAALRTVRALVGAAVPLLERRPRAHH